MTIEELKKLKEKKGYTYTQICDHSGVPIGTIIKIFSGQTSNPRRSTLDAIEKMLTDPQYEHLGKSFYYDEKSKPTVTSYTNAYGESVVREPVPFYGSDIGPHTVEEYNNLPQGVRVELIDGEFYDMSSPTPLHQEIVYQFAKQVDRFIDSNKGNCKVILGPVDVQLDLDDKTMLVPDVMILCDRSKLRDRVYGAPDFVLEVLSPSTQKKDFEKKCPKYRNAGVQEYWMIDPLKKMLIKYDFTGEDYAPYVPQIMPLQGTEPINMYHGKCIIDLSEFNRIICDYE